MSSFTCCFQSLLLELKQFSFVCFPRNFTIISDRISPFEYLSTLLYFFRAIFEEAQLRIRIILYLVQQMSALLNFYHLLLDQLSRFAMVVESFVMEDVPCHFILALFYDCFFLLKLLITFLQFGVYITRVISTCFLTVFLPVSKTQPAEIMFAFSAGHVHATLVLLNIGRAFRAGLAICFDPS